MRILRIAGRNLTSLSGDFEVALDRPPLSRAAAFAISGPTGAGKSTLLDALCLALYGQTPRLQGNSLAQGIGQDGLGDRDGRNLLRRGAPEGRAEVDFRDREGRTWRARWSVSRVGRGKTKGNIQTAQHTLLALEDGLERDVSEAVPTRVLAQIEERVGLSFPQFCRSVLLAQGEFAAFLRARAAERADLLERMTGTEVYKLVSARIFERTREARERVEALDHDLEGAEALEAEARTVLETRRETFARERAERRAALDADRHGLAWHRRASELEANLAKRESELAAARARHEEAAPERERLAAWRSVLPHRPLLRQREAARDLLERRNRDLSRTRAELETARRSEALAAEAWERAETEHLHRMREREALRPRLDEAAGISARLEELGRQLDEDTARTPALRKELAQREAEARALEERRAARTVPLQEIRSELAERPDDRLLAGGWEGWRRDLLDLRGLEQERRQRGLELQALRDENARQAAEIALAEAERDGATRNLAAAQEERERRGRDRLLPEDTDLVRLEALRGHWLTLDARLEAATRRGVEIAGLVARHEIEREDALREAREARERLPTLEARLDEVDRSLADLREREPARIAALRRALRPGTPCPVCGSESHPACGEEPDAPLWGADIAGLEARRAELEAQRRAAAETAARREAEADLADRARTVLEEESFRLEGDKRAALAEIGEIRQELTERIPSRPAPGDPDALGSLLAADRAATEDFARAREAETEVARARERILANLERLAAARSATGREVARLVESRSLLEEREAATLGRLASLWELDPSWRARAAEDPTALGQQLRRRVDRFTELDRRLAELETQETEDAPLQAVVEASLAGLRTREEELANRLAALEALATPLRDRLRELFPDESPESAEQRLRATLEADETRSGIARAALQEARVALGGATAREETARREAETGARDLEALERRLEEARVGLGLAAETFEALLAMDDGEILAERLDALDREVERLSGLFDASLREREALAATRPERDEATLLEAVSAREEALAGLEREDGALAERLAADDRILERRAGIAGELASAWTDHERWDVLCKVAGSADGAKLSRFAQRLSLEWLLAETNAHLGRLSPRYRLEPLPGAGLDFAVRDEEIGGELRPLQSLSGGETFLCSLALALGLSSLSSDSVQLGNLFVDEGFGTLDGETLGIALSVLQSLRDQGRQVGLISHVPEMASLLGAEVRVVPVGRGCSRVRVLGPGEADQGSPRSGL